LRPGYNGWVSTGGRIEVLEGVGDVLGRSLSVREQVIGDVEVDGVGEVFLGEELADVGLEGGGASGAGAGGHEDGLFGTPSEVRDVDGGAELRFGDVEWGVARDGVVECF